MDKHIGTLVEDIYTTIKKGVELKEEEKKELGSKLVDAVLQGLGKKEEQPKGQLRMSNFGTPCKRKLWYTINRPEAAEEIQPWTRFKFAYGHVLETIVLWLAKKSNHSVVGEQEKIEFNGIIGHRDAIIDGLTVDIKSANSRGMDKFKEHQLESNDPFGYLDQLSLYTKASTKDDRLMIKKEAAFLAVDKELGHLVLDKYKVKDITEEEIEATKEMLRQSEPPRRHYDPVKDGESGNYKLGMECRYCDHKWSCWPGLRMFLYAEGPRWLTRVVREPNVKEITPTNAA